MVSSNAAPAPGARTSTKDLGIPADRLAATTYTDDEVAWNVWRDEIGLPPERMARWGDVDAGDDKNFWRMAETGPCGPCSEIHFDRGASSPRDRTACRTTPRRVRAGSRSGTSSSWSSTSARTAAVPLPFTSVDTGLGLERLASVLQQVPTNYDTDLFAADPRPDARAHRATIPSTFEAERFSYQVIADHSRAVTFLIADGVLPSNEGRGYVLRRLLRRAVRHGRLLGRREPFLAETAAVVIDVMAEAYPHLVERATRSSAPSRARRRSSPGRSTPARGSSRRRCTRSRATERTIGRRRPRTCRPTRRRSPATSRSGSTTRTASRST